MIDKIPEFKNPELLKQALTHRSYLNENDDYQEDIKQNIFIKKQHYKCGHPLCEDDDCTVT